MATEVAEIYREYGALEYREFAGDDMNRTGTRSFDELVDTKEGEIVVFGWIAYDSKESRDRINRCIENDPRLSELVAPLLDPEDPVFVPGRMAFGGFSSLVQ